ncbi:lysozyme [Paradevosia shaoguanensis]|uniref:Lysozyme n=1 Tax=Paradevosia shaoguanensis TaxID=1335043 RepID=A0AA41QK59_9HYPH|nr:lysozyme [Paradevosia shaoguanensis]MCF1740715.1 lysozyme [Paradevosia shaoguanensis]MCI0125199.1 lysozyme [Paradevosia shaoguanensis]
MKRLTKGIIAGSAALTMLATGFISQWEGRSLRAYQDIVNVWTICDGDTKGVTENQVATPRECDERLARDLRIYEMGIDRCLTAPVPGKVKVSFLELAYNVGVGAFCSSTLVKKANRGDLRGACDELLKWVRAGGRVVQGLINRREASRRLCLEGLV